MEATAVSKRAYFKKVHYKYILAQTLIAQTDIINAAAQISGYVVLRQDGLLVVYAGYASDGPSGPTIDTDDFIAGAFVHDALYQLMRMRKLGQEWRKLADKELIKICKRCGMAWWRRAYIEWALSRFAGYAAKPNAGTIYSVPA